MQTSKFGLPELKERLDAKTWAANFCRLSQRIFDRQTKASLRERRQKQFPKGGFFRTIRQLQLPNKKLTTLRLSCYI
jgi:hypothetical protein